MKCTNCGWELPEHAHFCNRCGTPVDDSQTMLADDRNNGSADGYHNEPPYDPHSDFRDGYNNFNTFENNPVPTGYPDRRFDERVTENRPYDYNNAPPRYDAPYGGSPYPEPPRNRQKTVLIISVISVVLLIAALGAVIFFVSRTNVSSAELDEAKEKFLPPAQAVTIDSTLDDPSNDQIKFKYDSRARIASCTYDANKKTYDQNYRYNDDNRKITIDTKYRDHIILTTEIDYDRVKKADDFESIDGYYVRLDEQSLGKTDSPSATVPVMTAAPEPTEPKKPTEPPQPTQKPTQPPKPTQKPTEKPKATQKPAEPSTDWKDLYIDYLNSTSIDYSYGALLYINDDDIPELVLTTTGAVQPTYVCYITDGSVQTFATGASEGLSYSKRNGYFVSGRLHMGIYNGMIYHFDGDDVSEEHTLYCPDINSDEYRIDGESMTKSEYQDYMSDYSFIEDSSKYTRKKDLPDSIRNF